MDPNHPFFDKIEQNTNVKKEDIFSLANSVANANFQDEQTVRQIVSRVAQMANTSISKDKEEQIVKAIVDNDVPMDFSSLAKMFDKK
ncbi:stage VI sporulation protein F [Tuberibacillus sp. Marseille-P3662]|uniref:stage VI sporulation protein F n=1 Tax=Tuberibacillus sp. Marseille-P3662 TaxID=1965358 RepID=UPI000A1C9C24|nr:stage VI sporulation protein F [Tuberibacillus sp. Marseille-P3662]